MSEATADDLTRAYVELQGSPAGRRALSAASIVYFDSYYCGMRYARHREHWLTTMENGRARAEKDKVKERMLLLAPRDHGKTEALVTFVVQLICRFRDIRILWICESEGMAVKRIQRVKAILESAKIQEDWCSDPANGYGPFVTREEGKWTESQVYCIRPTPSVDPTLEAVGSGGAITGGHYSIILGDDLESLKTTATQAVREKQREWFFATVTPMLIRGGYSVILGTRKHHDDLYAHFISNPSWKKIVDQAISVWPTSYKFVTEREADGQERLARVEMEDGSKAKVLWPEERNIEYLLRELYALGRHAQFMREFQNMVQDDQGAIVKEKHLREARDRGAPMRLYHKPPEHLVNGTLDVVTGWDLALVDDAREAEDHDRDFTVGITWARDGNGNRFLLGMCRERGCSPQRLKELAVREHYRFKELGLTPRSVAVERNNFGRLHVKRWMQETDLPIVPHLTTGAGKADPWHGVSAMGSLYENGKVYLPYGDVDSRAASDLVCAELWGLGKETHDDTTLATWIAECQFATSPFVYQYFVGDKLVRSRGIGEEPVVDEERTTLIAPEHREGYENEDGTIDVEAYHNANFWAALTVDLTPH